MPEGVTIEGQESIDKLLRQLAPENFIEVVISASLKIGEQIREKMAQSPGSSHSPVIWASDKQRKWWFASRRKDGKPLKYSRGEEGSQNLQQSWTVQATSDGAIVGTRATYADMVQSSEKQQPQHKATGWVTDAEAVEFVQSAGIIDKYVKAEISSFLAGLG